MELTILSVQLSGIKYIHIVIVVTLNYHITPSKLKISKTIPLLCAHNVANQNVSGMRYCLRRGLDS